MTTENWVSEGTVTYTARIGFGVELCDPRTGVIHTGSWSQMRRGTRGRWPKKAGFITACGQQLESNDHHCDHDFVECEDCKAKTSAVIEPSGA